MRLDSKRALTAALATLLVLTAPTLASCSGGADEPEPATSAGAATAAAAPTIDAGQADEPGDDTVVGLGSDLALPENWPAAIPAYAGGSLVSVVVADGATQINATWLTDAKTPEAAADMGAAMEAAGFTSGLTATASDMSSVDYAGNGYTVNVTIYTSGEQSNVSINASKE